MAITSRDVDLLLRQVYEQAYRSYVLYETLAGAPSLAVAWKPEVDPDLEMDIGL